MSNEQRTYQDLERKVPADKDGDPVAVLVPGNGYEVRPDGIIPLRDGDLRVVLVDGTPMLIPGVTRGVKIPIRTIDHAEQGALDHVRPVVPLVGLVVGCIIAAIIFRRELGAMFARYFQ